MSDFTSGFWNWYVIVLTLRVDRLSARGCCMSIEPQAAWQPAPPRRPAQDSRDDRPRLGRRPRRVQQPAAALVDVAVLDHHRVLARLPGRSIRGWASCPACSAGRRRGAYASESAERRRAGSKPLYDKYLGDGPQAGRGRSAGAARWASGCSSTTARSATAPTPAAQGLPEPARQRLALRRRAGDDRRRRSPTAAWASCRRSAPALGAEGVKNVVAYVRSLSGLPQRQPAGAARQAAVRAELRGVPRRGRQGQPGDRRAEPHRRDLAVRQLRGDDRRGHQQGPPRRHRSPSTRRCRRTRTSLGAGKIQLLAAYVWGLSNAAGGASSRRRGAWRTAAARLRLAPRRRARTSTVNAADQDRSRRRRRRRPEEVALYEIRKKIYPRAVHGAFARWRWALVFAHADRLLRPAVAHVERPPGGAVRPRRAQVLHLRPRVLAAGRHLPRGAADPRGAARCSCSPRSPGRLWCGYACPQTVYTEIFLWIERKIEGDRARAHPARRARRCRSRSSSSRR